MRIGTFNVLADAYLHYGDSLPSDPKLQKSGSRIEPLKKVINSLEADVLTLQEVDGKLALVNTHLKWSPPDDPEHKGLGQARELLAYLGDQPAVILVDCNDRPGGPVRQCFAGAGFHDLVGDTPTARVDGQTVPIDIIAPRGVAGRLMPPSHAPTKPNRQVPSDHIPVLADIKRP